MDDNYKVNIEFEGRADAELIEDIRPDIQDGDYVRVICSGKDALNPVLRTLAKACNRDDDHTPGIVRSNEEQYAFMWQQCTERQTDVPRQVLRELLRSEDPLTYDQIHEAIDEEISRVRLQTHIGKFVDRGVLERTGRPVEIEFSSPDTRALADYVVNIADRHL